MKRAKTICAVLVLGITVSTGASAVVPELIPVQGILTDDMGNPIFATVNMTFAMYDSATAISPFWSEIHVVDVDDGFFTAYLGGVAALPDNFTVYDDVWMGITVDTDAEMNRFRLAAVPYALEAQQCEQVGSLTEADITSGFLPASYTPSWYDLTDIPAGFADNTDNINFYDGSDFALSNQSCPPGQRVSGIDGNGNLICGSITPSCLVRSSTFTGMSGTVSCNFGETVTGGGFYITDGPDNFLNWNSAASYPNGNGYYCYRDIYSGGTCTCYAICCTFPS